MKIFILFTFVVSLFATDGIIVFDDSAYLNQINGKKIATKKDWKKRYYKRYKKILNKKKHHKKNDAYTGKDELNIPSEETINLD
jgi:hypothetical protein